jgi:hypothetical protein
MTTHPPQSPSISELLALSLAATPGKWRSTGITNHGRVETDELIVFCGAAPAFVDDADAKFIASLVNWFRTNAATLSGAQGQGVGGDVSWMLEAAKALDVVGMGIHATALATLAEGISTGRVVGAPPARVISDADVERALSAPFDGYTVSSFIPLKSPYNIRRLMQAALSTLTAGDAGVGKS